MYTVVMYTFNIYVHFTQISQTVQLKLMLYEYGAKLHCYTMTRFCEINEMNLKNVEKMSFFMGWC